MNRYIKKINRTLKKENIGWIKLNPSTVASAYKKYKTPPWGLSLSLVTEKLVITPPLSPPYEEEIFATALHEIGHCLSFLSKSTPEQQSHIRKLKLANAKSKTTTFVVHEEISAWNLARKLANSFWTPKMDAIQIACLSNYIAEYACNHKHTPFSAFYVHKLLSS